MERNDGNRNENISKMIYLLYSLFMKQIYIVLPIDSEFSLLYFLYFMIFSYITYQITRSKRANKIRLSLIIIVSVLLNMIFFLNPKNFEGGGSLVVLFYSGIIFLGTTISTFINQIISKKRINSKI